MRDDPLAAIGRLTLVAAAAGIRDGVFSAETLAVRYLQRILSNEGRIHAWAWFDGDRVLAEARHADAELRAGRLRGPLHGMPLGIKDVIHTRGIPTGMGSSIYADFVPAESAACVDRLEQAGAYVHGKTVTTEFATQFPGSTTNPWNTACTPGGSSSGSAAAVAAGFTPAALGTQTRGSIIRPAAYCGIVGFKPSLGLISRHGVHPLSQTLDHVGVLARDIDDAGLLTAVLAGSDPRDSGSVPSTALAPRFEALAELERPPRLAVIRSMAWASADAPQQALLQKNVEVLRTHGARVEAVDLPPVFAGAGEAARTIQLFEIAHNFSTLKRTAGTQMSATFRALCERGEQVCDERYREMLGLRDALCQEIGRLLTGFDAIVTPPASGEAPATLASTGDAAFCSLWTLCGLPCVVFPSGIGPRSLPMGLQVVGAYLNDARTLEIAKWCSRCLPFHLTPNF